MDQRNLRRQIDRTAGFEIGIIGVPDSKGRADVQSGGRAEPRSDLRTILAQPLQAGATCLMLAGGDNDRAQVIGISPFLGG